MNVFPSQGCDRCGNDCREHYKKLSKSVFLASCKDYVGGKSNVDKIENEGLLNF